MIDALLGPLTLKKTTIENLTLLDDLTGPYIHQLLVCFFVHLRPSGAWSSAQVCSTSLPPYWLSGAV